MGGGDRGHTQPLGESPAPGDVGLQAVDGARRAHALEVGDVEAILAGSHVAAHALAHNPQAVEVVGRDGLLQPRDAERLEPLGQAHGLLGRVGAVGVHVELGFVADGAPSDTNPLDVAALAASPRCAHLHLDPGNAVVVDPSAELALELLVGQRREPAASVRGDLVVDLSEESGEGDAQHAGLEVPQGRVDGRHRHRCGPPSADIADGDRHVARRARHVQHVGALDDRGQLVSYQGGARRGTVGVAESGRIAGRGIDDDDRRLRPRQRAVGLGLLRRHAVGGRADLINLHQLLKRVPAEDQLKTVPGDVR